MRSALVLAVVGLSIPFAARAGAATRQVGPGKAYAAPCAAIAAAADGDVIEIAAGTYKGDVCEVKAPNLTLRGVGGRPVLDADGQNYGGKAIWVVSGANTTVENVEFTGCAVTDKNGAGIRIETSKLTVRGCSFHDNENGLLGGDGADIVIEGTELARNGAGDGYSHNLYIGHAKTLLFRGNYSHDAKIGHLFKSRAAENRVLYNRLTGEQGTDSYEVDIPNGGTSWVIGNVIEQGAATDNPGIVSYLEEGPHAANPGATLYVASNTIVNHRSAGGTFVYGAAGTTLVLANNIFSGPGTVTNMGGAQLLGNLSGVDALFEDEAAFDFRLKAGSPAIDKGVTPPSGNALSLVPAEMYMHPASTTARGAVGPLDVGAFEFGAPAPGTDAGSGGGDGGGAAGGSGGATGTDGGPSSDAAAAPGDGSSGCGCHVARWRAPGGAALGGLVALVALLARLASRRADRPGRRSRSGRRR